jgi:putative transposase
LDSHCSIAALEEAIDRYGAPQIVNADRGVQFTSQAFTALLKQRAIHISMDGKAATKKTSLLSACGERSNTSACTYRPSMTGGHYSVH